MDRPGAAARAGRQRLADPSIAFGQPPRRRIAWLAGARGTVSPFLDAFKAGMRELGYEEGRNIEIAAYFSDGTPGRTEELAREVIATKPGDPPQPGIDRARGAQAQPAAPGGVRVQRRSGRGGLRAEPRAPGGNMTGMTFLALDLVGKRIQTLREVLPQLKRVAVLANPQHAGEKQERNASEQAARSAGPGSELPAGHHGGGDRAGAGGGAPGALRGGGRLSGRADGERRRAHCRSSRCATSWPRCRAGRCSRRAAC